LGAEIEAKYPLALQQTPYKKEKDLHNSNPRE
jgi:hypothetical protein